MKENQETGHQSKAEKKRRKKILLFTALNLIFINCIIDIHTSAKIFAFFFVFEVLLIRSKSGGSN